MIDSTMFDIKERGDHLLITPSHHGAVANAPWNRDTLVYRSRVQHAKTGVVVSQGFKKFFNLGTGPLDLAIGAQDVAAAITKKDAIATFKIDGSLLIRSEVAGEVMLRTRGSFGYDHLANAGEMELFREMYPKMFKAGGLAECSLLFEWVSPANPIVVKYPTASLTLIGGIAHLDMAYFSMATLKVIAELLEVPLVQYWPLDTKGWDLLQQELEVRQDIEGYVVRLHNEQDLVKVKCLPHLTKHALKSSLTTEKLADMWFQQGRPGFTRFYDNFVGSFDEETALWALGAISNLFDGVKTLEKIEAHMQGLAASRKGLPRKEAALAGIQDYGQTKKFSAYMNLWEGQPVRTETLKSILLQNTKQVELGMFKKEVQSEPME